MTAAAPPSGQATITPYDLAAPDRLLYPHPHDRSMRHQDITVGAGKDTAAVEYMSWDRCRPGCASANGGHDPGYSVVLRVACDQLPHCAACECGSGHTVRLSAQDVLALRRLLP